MYTMKTTLNGQFMLAMLCESLANNIPDLTMLQVNTDGVTVRIPSKHRGLYESICKSWEEDTRLTLEYVDYKKMVIRDVNNYIAVTVEGKVKEKGAFETKKDLHKDNSFMIVPIALREFFVNNTPIEDTIRGHRDIYDFCGRQKFKGKDYGKIRYIEDAEIVESKQQKNVRYFISKPGVSFVKCYAKGTEEIINKGYQVTIFNKFEDKEFKNYMVDYSFYVKECLKEIEQIINRQGSLL